MSYCSYTELTNLTASTLSQTIQEAIISQADREIDARLGEWGLSGSAGDATLKAVSLKLSQAGLLLYGLHNGTYESVSGDFDSKVNVTNAVKALTERAHEMLDSYIYINTESTDQRVFGRRVDGR